MLSTSHNVDLENSPRCQRRRVQSKPIWAARKTRRAKNIGASRVSRSAPNAESVTVSVPARLHLGFVDLHGGLGRRFGGIALALNQLGTAITIARSTHMQVDGPERERARSYLETMHRVLELNGAYHLTMEQ